MDYVTLCGDKSVAGSIGNWVNDSRIPSVADALINEAMNNIFMQLRHWRMQTPLLPQTFAQGADSVIVPDDFIEPALLVYTGNQKARMQLVTIEELSALITYDASGNRQAGQPLNFAMAGGILQLDLVTDKAYNWLMSYYQRPVALSSSNPTNWLTQLYPRLVRSAIMLAATEWMKDSGQGTFDRTYWTVVFQQQVQAAQADSDRAKRSIVTKPILLR